MNPRRPYNPQRRARSARLTLWLGVGLASLGVAGVVIWVWPRSTGAAGISALPSATSLPTVMDPNVPVLPTLTPAPLTAAPTVTLPPPVSPTPDPTTIYFTQAGDTLPVLAARFGVAESEIQAPQGLAGVTMLKDGLALVIPQTLTETTPAERLVPDSELVFSGSGAGFDPQAFAVEQGGYLATYTGYVEERNLRGGEVILLAAQNHSINPRLLTALVEYQSGWVTNPAPSAEALQAPLGYAHAYRDDLYSQLSWATSQLGIGYYGWRDGTLTTLHFPDGSTLRLAPTLNAGTVALQYFFAQSLNRPAWDAAVGAEGFVATYIRLLGDPWQRATLLLPAELIQPPLQLPLLPGHRWAYTGGPHGAWEHGGAQAALDFAPAVNELGCTEPSDEWVTAVAAGRIVRADYGSVSLDLDGDGRETTGWVILYLHLADADRVQAGDYVEAGQRIGHPSCRGGQATGTHVHLARKYNGEWIPAAGVVPFNLSGWTARAGAREYAGQLVRGDATVTACTCADTGSAIVADEK